MTHSGKKIKTWIYELHEKPIHPFSFPLFACFLFSRPLVVVLSQRGEWHRLMATQSHGYIIPLTAHLTCIFEDHGRKRCNSETSFTSKTTHHTEEKNNISSKMIADANQKVLKTSKASWRVSTTTPALPVGRMEGLWSRTTSEPTEQQLWHPRHSSPNVALTQSLKKVT